MSTNQEAVAKDRIPASIFLSHASEDRDRAVWLHDRLMEAGLDDVWLDCRDIDGGKRWDGEINEGLRKATMLVWLLTRSSVDPSRVWIEYEIREAQRLLKPIIPLRYEGEPPQHLKRVQFIDFRDDPNAGLSALLNVIKKHAGRYTSRLKLADETPGYLDVFVGRETEIQELFALIDTPSDRVMTARPSIAIQGMGGQGKTMLAGELARRIGGRYPGGVLFVERGESRRPAQEVLQKWAKLAGYEASDKYEPSDVCHFLSGYGELLVLIDDVSELDFEETKLLLAALPLDATRLLTTRSRDVTSAFGSVMYELYHLKDDDAQQLVRGRLRAKVPATSAPDDSPKQDDAIRRLVELVQGHALALEVTCGRCNVPGDLPREVDHLAHSLAEGLDRLVIEGGASKDNSLQVSLNISFERLKEYDRKLQPSWANRLAALLSHAVGIATKPSCQTNWAERFTALGVFPDSGRMNLALIAAVWGDMEEDEARTHDALSGIFRRAMIKREPESEIYRNHPLLSAFARSLLRKNPQRLAATERRYRNFLTLAEKGLSEHEEQWVRLDSYAPHLLHTARQLWDECTSLLGDPNELALPEAPVAEITLANPAALEAASQAANFSHALMDYVLRRPALGEDGRRILTLGLAGVRASGNRELQDTFVRALGAWYARSEPSTAERYFQQALRWAKDTGDRSEEGRVLSAYGELERNRTNFDEAIQLLDRALVIHEDLGDQRMQAVTLKSSGEAHGRLCNFEIAMDHYNRAIQIYRELKEPSGVADLLNKIGSVEFNRGNYKGAISSFMKALPIHRHIVNRSMEGEDLNDMGISCNYLQRPKRALTLLKEAIEIHNQLGNRRLEAIAISNRAAAFYALGRKDPGNYEKAVLEARKSRAIARQIEDPLTEVWALNWEALAQQELGKPELALPVLLRADALLDHTGPRERVSTRGSLGYLLGKDLGQRERGAKLLEEAINLMREQKGFTRAFGGRTLADLKTMLREISA